jgi:hypothetical protein
LRRNAVQKVSASERPVHGEHLAPTVNVDAHCDDDCGRDDAAVLAHLHVGRIDPQVGPFAPDRRGEERLHLIVEFRRRAD